MPSCLVADCEILGKYARIYLFYTLAFFLTLFIPVTIWCAMNKASFVFYRCWKCINDRNDSLKPTFSNVKIIFFFSNKFFLQAKKLAEITWSEFFYSQRQIERARFELIKELTIIEKIRRNIQHDLKKLPNLTEKKQVFFVENHKPRLHSSSSSSGITVSSIGLSTTC